MTSCWDFNISNVGYSKSGLPPISHPPSGILVMPERAKFGTKYVFFGWLSSAVRSFTKIFKMNFEISWNFYEKNGLNEEKFATFWMFPERFSRSFVLQMTLTLYDRQNASRLAQFRKPRKRMNRGKTQCWALFVTFKATFTKTAIKPKFDDRFSFKKFQCCSWSVPDFRVHWKNLIYLSEAQNWVNIEAMW